MIEGPVFARDAAVRNLAFANDVVLHAVPVFDGDPGGVDDFAAAGAVLIEHTGIERSWLAEVRRGLLVTVGGEGRQDWLALRREGKDVRGAEGVRDDDGINLSQARIPLNEDVAGIGADGEPHGVVPGVGELHPGLEGSERGQRGAGAGFGDEFPLRLGDVGDLGDAHGTARDHDRAGHLGDAGDIEVSANEVLALLYRRRLAHVSVILVVPGAGVFGDAAGALAV